MFDRLLQILVLLCIISPGITNTQDNKKHYLIITSYNPNTFKVEQEMLGSVLENLHSHIPNFKPTIKYLDAHNKPFELGSQHLEEELNGDKALLNSIDGVITLNNEALVFANAHADLFGKIPVVSGGFNGYNPDKHSGNIVNFSIAHEDFDFRPLVRAALTLNPETTRVVMLSGCTLVGRVLLEQSRATIKPMVDHLGIGYKEINNVSWGGAIAGLSQLSPTDLLFILTLRSDINGVKIGDSITETNWLNTFIPKHTQAFSWWGVYIDAITGGHLLDIEKHGSDIVELMLSPYSGRVIRPTLEFKFNEHRLTEAQFEALPVGSTLIGGEKGKGGFNRNTLHIIGVTQVIMILIWVILYVVWLKRHRKRKKQIE